MGNAQLALDTLLRRPTTGIPGWALFLMEHAHIERLAGDQGWRSRTWCRRRDVLWQIRGFDFWHTGNIGCSRVNLRHPARPIAGQDSRYPYCPPLAIFALPENFSP